MVAHKHPPHITLEEYFEREEAAVGKSEYYDGVIVAMAGASLPHVRITSNLRRNIGNQVEGRGLEGRDCEVFDNDLRLYAEACRMVFYPDLLVTCGTPQFHQTRLATLLNPTLIMEVLSSSTERADRGIKFDCYRAIPSMQTYVLVSQVEPRIEIFSRQADDSWRIDVISGLDAILRLPAIGCELRLNDIYVRVEFPPLPPVEEV